MTETTSEEPEVDEKNVKFEDVPLTDNEPEVDEKDVKLQDVPLTDDKKQPQSTAL